MRMHQISRAVLSKRMGLTGSSSSSRAAGSFPHHYLTGSSSSPRATGSISRHFESQVVSSHHHNSLARGTSSPAFISRRTVHSSGCRWTRHPFTEISPVFQRIQSLSNEEIVAKVKAVYLFDVENEGKWFVDLAKGSGAAGEGSPPDGEKPDVTIVINKENLLKMFNRELKPATAFMSGKLKLSGDLSKALALESIMKASRED